MRKHSKERPPPSLADLQGAPPMGTLSQDYSNHKIHSLSVVTFNFFIYYRVFTFGIGSGVSTELVKGIAKAGNGKAEFIYEGEQMQPKVHIVEQTCAPAYIHTHTSTY